MRSGFSTTRGRPAPGLAPPQPEPLRAAMSEECHSVSDKSTDVREIIQDFRGESIRTVLGGHPLGKPLVQAGSRDQDHAIEAEKREPLVSHPVPKGPVADPERRCR